MTDDRRAPRPSSPSGPSGPSPSDEAFRRLVDEARREGTPPLDWDAVESSLLGRVAANELSPLVPQRRPGWVIPAALAAFTAVAAGGAVLLFPATPPPVVGTGEVANVAPAPIRPERRETVDGDALAAGAVVAAEATPVVVEHVKHVTWTVVPGGLAHVETVGDVVALSLDKGSLFARVTRSPRPESFVVRVEKSRIAVHGTAFRIDRLEKSVHVEVTEGVVAIGPVGGQSFELTAPGNVEVSFDGVRKDEARRSGPAVPTDPSPIAATDSTDEPAPGSDTESVTGGGKSPATQAARTPNEAPGVERVIQAVRRCLSEHTVAGGDLRVSVRTRLSLRVQSTGHVGEVLFDPPLAPPVLACVGARVGSIGFAASHDGFALERVIELER